MYKIHRAMQLSLLCLLCLVLPVLADEGQVQLREQTYQKKCSFCHQPKKASILPDMKAWNHLLYTSACPQVSLTLTDTERKLIKLYLEQSFKENTKKTSDQSSNDRSEKK